MILILVASYDNVKSFSLELLFVLDDDYKT